jgi:hypothetical protein
VLLALVAAAALAGLTGSASPAAGRSEPEPIVSVTRHGGLCVTATECRSFVRIGDRRISGNGYVTRTLAPGDRAALLRAIDQLDLGYLRSHPFRGTCPIAYDGIESIYRFRGFPRVLASCKYDLRGVRAVRLVDRLLATLKPAHG